MLEHVLIKSARNVAALVSTRCPANLESSSTEVVSTFQLSPPANDLWEGSVACCTIDHDDECDRGYSVVTLSMATSHGGGRHGVPLPSRRSSAAGGAGLLVGVDDPGGLRVPMGDSVKRGGAVVALRWRRRR